MQRTYTVCSKQDKHGSTCSCGCPSLPPSLPAGLGLRALYHMLRYGTPLTPANFDESAGYGGASKAQPDDGDVPPTTEDGGAGGAVSASMVAS